MLSMKHMNITDIIAPTIKLPQTQKEAIEFARSFCPAPRVREMNDIAPTMKIIPSAIKTMNTGAAIETAASCKGS